MRVPLKSDDGFDPSHIFGKKDICFYVFSLQQNRVQGTMEGKRQKKK
jgi:hypothetical protein